MAAVLGIGGVFFKTRDKAALAAWYKRVLGVTFAGEWGTHFPHPNRGLSVLGPFPADTDYFDPSHKDFMINFIVDDLDGMLAMVEAAGEDVIWRSDDDPNGRFAHLIDPEGIKIELWEPKS